MCYVHLVPWNCYVEAFLFSSRYTAAISKCYELGSLSGSQVSHVYEPPYVVCRVLLRRSLQFMTEDMDSCLVILHIAFFCPGPEVVVLRVAQNSIIARCGMQ